MFKNLQNKKELNLLIIVFVIIGIFGVAVKYFEFYNIKIISATTTDIYEHPLKVSNAALTIKLDVYKIHRDMKDIVLSFSNEELIALIEEVNKNELHVYEKFSIIEHNILGDDGLKLEKKTRKLFDAWKPIRDEVI
ncbi:Four helix bundle sensory module for signal transduction, partial [Epsilonproteobacteria bacterium SCGC AD-308-E02]